MKILRETDSVKVYIDGDLKCLRSKDFNYDHNMVTGRCKTWGKTEKEDPEWCSHGPVILDQEITNICAGITKNGVKTPCAYCYKSNTANNYTNLSLEQFNNIITKVNANQQLQSVAFGLGASAEENPDLWDMCKFLRENYIVPNGTVAEISDQTAIKIAQNFGGCAVSFHGDIEVLADSIEKLSIAKKMSDSTLKQINIHAVVAEETYDNLIKLGMMIKIDPRFKDLYTVVLLGLKQCGRAKNGFTKLSDEKLENLVKMAIGGGINIGFDSCSCRKIEVLFKKFLDKMISSRVKNVNLSDIMAMKASITELRQKFDHLFQMMEPCESLIGSYYVNCNGVGSPCSFNENIFQYDVLNNDYFMGYWLDDKDVLKWRGMLKQSNRSCPIYNV